MAAICRFRNTVPDMGKDFSRACSGGRKKFSQEVGFPHRIPGCTPGVSVPRNEGKPQYP